MCPRRVRPFPFVMRPRRIRDGCTRGGESSNRFRKVLLPRGAWKNRMPGLPAAGGVPLSTPPRIPGQPYPTRHRAIESGICAPATEERLLAEFVMAWQCSSSSGLIRSWNSRSLPDGNQARSKDRPSKGSPVFLPPLSPAAGGVTRLVGQEFPGHGHLHAFALGVLLLLDVHRESMALMIPSPNFSWTIDLNGNPYTCMISYSR